MNEQTSPLRRIGFDGRGVRPEPDGIGHASLRLLEGLLRVEREVEFVVWHLPESAARFPQNERVRLIACPPHHLSRFTLKRMGRWVDRERVDLFHAPFFLAPLRCETPLVVTVHDLLALEDRDFFEGPWWRLKGWFHRRYVPKVLHRARRILCVSDTVATRVRELVPEPTSVAAVHHGIDSQHWNQPATADARHRMRGLDLPERFFLHVGRWRPYKGLGTLLAAYRTYRDRTRRAPLGLVLCRGGGSRSVERLLDSYEIRETVRIVEGLDDAQVVALTQQATALLQPSRYEGFGLPVLEAMAAGTPVLVSRGGALPEIVGDAGLLHAVGHHEELAALMERVGSEPDLCRTLSEKGRARASEFTTERMARATLAIYRQALEKPHPTA